MGFFLKTLLILLLVFFLLGRIGWWILRVLLSGMAKGQMNGQGFNKHQKNRPPGSNVDVEYMPKQTGNGKFSGDKGEYIDYEEVK